MVLKSPLSFWQEPLIRIKTLKEIEIINTDWSRHYDVFSHSRQTGLSHQPIDTR